MNQDILALIKTVNDHCMNTDELVKLGDLLFFTKNHRNEFIICMTTYNSRYDYKVLKVPEYQNPNNHIDKHWVDQRVAQTYDLTYYEKVELPNS